jgi:hypothetical protein
MRAFVNQARVALAEKNNLELPEHSVTERDLWQAFTTTVLSPGRAATARATLDLHRKTVQLPSVGKSVVARAEGAIGGQNVILNIRASSRFFTRSHWEPGNLAFHQQRLQSINIDASRRHPRRGDLDHLGIDLL